jgi:imidazolonepropionase-like amidohydrolase
VRQQIHDGADGVKIFTGSVESGGILLMPLDVAKAIVAEAHRAGKPVFAHPSNGKGIEIAIQAGVDVLAHPSTDGHPFTPSLIERMKTAHMALIPTMTLLDVEGRKGNMHPADIDRWIDMAVQEVKSYSEAGGQILFGTDVGYINQFDTTEEFTLMSRAGMDFRQGLASLTTNPADRFGFAAHSGRVAKGMDADLVVLRADPSLDAAAFAKVKYTIRSGKVIHSEP